MPHGLREKLQFYLIDCKTGLGKLIDIFIILLNLIFFRQHHHAVLEGRAALVDNTHDFFCLFRSILLRGKRCQYRIVKEWVHMASKEKIVCLGYGLSYHDRDASHCKACGHLIYQEYDGD